MALGSQFHRGQVFHMGRLAFAVKRHDQRQADCNLSRSHGDDKKDHHLPIQIIVEPGEGDKSQVGGVEHQFQRHINNEQIAPYNNAQQAEAEEERAHNQVLPEANVHLSSFLLKRITPTIATSSSTETISKGNRYSVN